MQHHDKKFHVSRGRRPVRSTVAPTGIGHMIRCRREQLGLAQSELEARLGPAAGPGYIAQLESSRLIMPSWVRLQQLASVLDLPVEELVAATAMAQDMTQPDEGQGGGHRTTPQA